MTDFFDIAVTPSVLALQKQKRSLGMYTDAAGAGPGDPHTITQQGAELILGGPNVTATANTSEPATSRPMVGWL